MLKTSINTKQRMAVGLGRAHAVGQLGQASRALPALARAVWEVAGSGGKRGGKWRDGKWRDVMGPKGHCSAATLHRHPTLRPGYTTTAPAIDLCRLHRNPISAGYTVVRSLHLHATLHRLPTSACYTVVRSLSPARRGVRSTGAKNRPREPSENLSGGVTRSGRGGVRGCHAVTVWGVGRGAWVLPPASACSHQKRAGESAGR